MVEKTTRLEARDVCKRFFRKGRESASYFDAVAAMDLVLVSGELVEVVGRSGSGKTTLLCMLAGLLTPTSGTVSFEGQDLYALDEPARAKLRNEHFGVVPQGQTPLYDLTVLQNVCLPHGIYRDAREVEDRALERLGSLGIAELSECYPAELSGGELRRMALARALVNEPKVIFADEPTGDLDDKNTKVVLRTLQDAARRGASVLLVTHERSAASYADRTVRLGAS